MNASLRIFNAPIVLIIPASMSMLEPWERRRYAEDSAWVWLRGRRQHLRQAQAIWANTSNWVQKFHYFQIKWYEVKFSQSFWDKHQEPATSLPISFFQHMYVCVFVTAGRILTLSGSELPTKRKRRGGKWRGQVVMVAGVWPGCVDSGWVRRE